MKVNLSSFLQWRFNLYVFRKLSWKIVFYYIMFLGRLYFWLNKKESRRIEEALRSVFFGRKSESEVRCLTKSILQATTSHYHEKLFNAFSSAETLKKFFGTHIKSGTLATLDRALEEGKGVLLVTGHFGGIEYIPGYLAANDYPVSIIARFSSKALRDISIEKAAKFATKIIDADNTTNIMKAIHNNLKENRIVITQCDEIEKWRPSRKDQISFLGKRINLDRTINILQKRCDATVVFCVMHRTGNQQYEFIANSFQEIANQFQNFSGIPVGALLLKFLEQYIYKYPKEWYLWGKYSEIQRIRPNRHLHEKPASRTILRPEFGTL